MFEYLENDGRSEDETRLDEVQELLEKSNNRTKKRIRDEIEGEKKDLKFERKNFKQNRELIYERIDSLTAEIQDLTREGAEPERSRKEHLEDELFLMYRRLLDQKDRWADRRTEIKRRIRQLERELQELKDSNVDLSKEK